MTVLLEIDRQLFLLINHLPHHPLVDGLMLFLSALGRGAAIWFVLGLAIAFLEKRKKTKQAVVFPLIFAVAISAALVNLLLKPLVGRLRPIFTLPQTFLLGSEPEDVFSFPSGHATSSFAAAFVLAWRKKKLGGFFYLLAGIISFSRVYLGVHYPLDVLAGATFGVLIGKISLILTSDRLKFLKI